MFLMHPVSLIISLAAATMYAVQLQGIRKIGRQMKALIPMSLLAVIINAAFHHAGVTILTYLPGGNPLTLESILYGLASSGMLLAVFLWFSCVTQVLAADQFVYLFGCVAPSLSLILSMTVRFFPRFVTRFREIREARKNLMPMGQTEGRIVCIREWAAIFSSMVGWSMEHGMDTADSMKSRGYGLPGRTAYTRYRLTDRDRGLLLWMGLVAVFLCSCAVSGAMEWRYYPTLGGNLTGILPVGAQILYLLFCLTPVGLHGWEAYRWKHIYSGI